MLPMSKWLVVALCAFTSAAFGEEAPGGQSACERFSGCDKLERCEVDTAGQPKCVLDSSLGCPVDEGPTMCIANPCDMEPCGIAAQCVAYYCGGCTAMYYDADWNRLSDQQCGIPSPCDEFRGCGECEACEPNALKVPMCVREQNCCPNNATYANCTHTCGGKHSTCHRCVPVNCATADGGACGPPKLYNDFLAPVDDCPRREEEVAQAHMVRCSRAPPAGQCGDDGEVEERWFYDRSAGGCAAFAYQGCAEHSLESYNVFASNDTCMETCQRVKGCPPHLKPDIPAGCTDTPRLVQDTDTLCWQYRIFCDSPINYDNNCSPACGTCERCVRQSRTGDLWHCENKPNCGNVDVQITEKKSEQYVECKTDKNGEKKCHAQLNLGLGFTLDIVL